VARLLHADAPVLRGLLGRITHASRLLRDLGCRIGLAALGPGAWRDAPIFGCPALLLAWLCHGLPRGGLPCRRDRQAGRATGDLNLMDMGLMSAEVDSSAILASP
jgi:hypothetical protein